MKNALALFMSLFGLMAAGMAIISLYDLEGADKTLFVIFGILAVVCFLASWFIWKPARQN